MTRPLVLLAIKEDLAACGEDDVELMTDFPEIWLDIEESGDFPEDEEEEEDDDDESAYYLNMSPDEAYAAHLFTCVLRGISPTDDPRAERRQRLIDVWLTW